MESRKSENESELTSTVGNTTSTSNKEEKNDTNDATPTSSTDATTAHRASKIISDDPISSTSSDTIEKSSSSMSKISLDDVDKVTTVDHVADLLEINVGNERITEDVEDLVHDLESLLGESTDSFIIPVKTVETKLEAKAVADDSVSQISVDLSQQDGPINPTKSSNIADIQGLEDCMKKKVSEDCFEISIETVQDCETSGPQRLELDDKTKTTEIVSEILPPDRKGDGEDIKSIVQSTVPAEVSVQSSENTPENETVIHKDKETVQTISTNESIKTDSDESVKKALSLISTEIISNEIIQPEKEIDFKKLSQPAEETTTHEEVIQEGSVLGEAVAIELEAGTSKINAGSPEKQAVAEPVLIEKTSTEEFLEDIQPSVVNFEEDIPQGTVVDSKLNTTSQTSENQQRIIEQLNSDIEEKHSRDFTEQPVVENSCEEIEVQAENDEENFILPEKPVCTERSSINKHAKFSNTTETNAVTEDVVENVLGKDPASAESSPLADCTKKQEDIADIITHITQLVDGVKENTLIAGETSILVPHPSDTEFTIMKEIISEVKKNNLDEKTVCVAMLKQSESIAEEKIEDKVSSDQKDTKNVDIVEGIVAEQVDDISSQQEESEQIVESLDADIKSTTEISETAQKYSNTGDHENPGTSMMSEIDTEKVENTTELVASEAIEGLNELEEKEVPRLDSEDLKKSVTTIDVNEEVLPREKESLTESENIPINEVNLEITSTKQENQSVEASVVDMIQELNEIDVEVPSEEMPTEEKECESIAVDSVVDCIQGDTSLSNVTEELVEETTIAIQKSPIQESENLVFKLSSGTNEIAIPSPNQEKESPITLANAIIEERTGEKESAEVIVEETGEVTEIVTCTKNVVKTRKTLEIDDVKEGEMIPALSEPVKKQKVEENVDLEIGDDQITFELPVLDEQPVVKPNQAETIVTSQYGLKPVPGISVANEDKVGPSLEPTGTLNLKTTGDGTSVQKSLNVIEEDIAANDEVTHGPTVVDISSDPSSLAIEAVIDDLVSVESEEPAITETVEGKVSDLEFAPLVLSEDDSDDDSVPTLALDPDEQNLPSEVIPDEIDDANICQEPLPSIDEALVVKPTFDELPTNSMDVQANLETMLAVAALQNIDVPRELEPETMLSDNERREMEALQRAVESITDCTVSPYVEDVNDLSAIVDQESEILYELKQSSPQPCSSTVEENTQYDIPMNTEASNVEPTIAAPISDIDTTQDLQEFSVSKTEIDVPILPTIEQEKIGVSTSETTDELVGTVEIQDKSEISINEVDGKLLNITKLPTSLETSEYIKKSKDEDYSSSPRETVKTSTEEVETNQLESDTSEKFSEVQEEKSIIDSSSPKQLSECKEEAKMDEVTDEQPELRVPVQETSIDRSTPLSVETEVVAIQESDEEEHNKQLTESKVSEQETSTERSTSLIVQEQVVAGASAGGKEVLATKGDISAAEEQDGNKEMMDKQPLESSSNTQETPVEQSTSLVVEEEKTLPGEEKIKINESKNKQPIKSKVPAQESTVEHISTLMEVAEAEKEEVRSRQLPEQVEQGTPLIVEEVAAKVEADVEKVKSKRLSESKVPEQETAVDSSGIVSETIEIQLAKEKEIKVKASERTRKHKKIDNKLEQLSINVDVPDGEKPYSPKISIKPIRVPDDEVSTTSTTDLDIVKGSLKMTITKQSDKLHSVLKVVDTDNQDIHLTEQEEPIPKLIIKSKMQQMEPQHSPKMSTRSSKQSYSPTASGQRSLSPRITIKPVVKPENKEPLSPLKIKIGLKPEEASKKKVTIKPIAKSDDVEPRVEQSPRITIKPIPKPEVELIPRLNIKAIKKQEEEIEERSSPKITIKPIVKPPEESQPTEEEDTYKERIVLKINKGNLPTPSKDSKKREHPPEDEKSEKLAKITVKFSKEGGHPHIVQQVEEGSKRPHEEHGVQDKSKKQKTEVESIISTRSRHKEQVQAEGTDLKYKLKDNPENPHKHKDIPHEYHVETKRLKKDESSNARSRRSSSRTRQKDVENADDIQIIEPKLNSPIVISEDSRSQDSSVILLDEFKDDSASDVSLLGINLDGSKGMPARSDSGLSHNSASSVTPSPRKRGRPRKVPVEVREEFKEQEDPSPAAKPSEEVVAALPVPQPVHESGRPKRSCVGQSVCDTLGIKPRKPRGPGRGRGGKRGAGNRPLSNKESSLVNTVLDLQQEFLQAESHEIPNLEGKHHFQIETEVKKDEVILGDKNLTILIDDSDDVILVVEPDLEVKATPPTRGGKRKYKSRGKRRSFEITNREVVASTSTNLLLGIQQAVTASSSVQKPRISETILQKSTKVIESSLDEVTNPEVSAEQSAQSNPSPASPDKKDDSVDVSSTVDEENAIKETEPEVLEGVIDKDTPVAVEEVLPGDESILPQGNHEREGEKSLKVDSTDDRVDKAVQDIHYSVSLTKDCGASKVFSNLGSSVTGDQGMSSSLLPLLETSQKLDNPEIPLVSSSSLPSEEMMVDEDTRMSADTSSRAQTPAKQIVTPSEMVVEESQSSVHSNGTTESGKTPSARPNKAPRLEVQETETVDITADLLTEYHWNGNGPFMIQEQVAHFLGIKSFKRKYPNIPRRILDMQERDFVREKGLVSENMCDLGLTSVNSADILDIMYSDFQEKYEEYCKHLRDRQAKELITKQRALSLAASQEKNKADILKQAVHSAALWNARFNKNRKDERRACMDLQTLTVHYPKGRVKQMNKSPVGHYPVAVVPGQFTDYFEEFTPTEINNLPLNTLCYDNVSFIPRDDSEDSRSESSDSESSGSSTSGSDSDSSSGIEDCKLCKHSPSKKASVK